MHCLLEPSGVVVPIFDENDYRWTDIGGDRREHMEGPVPSLSDVGRKIWKIQLRRWVVMVGVNTVPFVVLIVVNLFIIRALYRHARTHTHI
jgi:hypothetical protein